MPESRAAPRPVPAWLDRLLVGLGIYVTVCATWMLSGLGGEQVRHYLGLLADSPACLITAIAAAAAARGTVPGAARLAWQTLALAFSLSLISNAFAVSEWLHGRDPFPGVADVFLLAFCVATQVAVILLIRAAAVRVPWGKLVLDAMISVVGFGAFFWFLVIRPASSTHTILPPGSGFDVEFVKHILSQVYLAFDCILLLTFGVLLLTGSSGQGNRRASLLLLGGFATTFLADIVWALAKVSGHYLPGDIEDVLYLFSYLPLTLAGRAQLRGAAPAVPSASTHRNALAESLPYMAMLTAFLVLVYFTGADANTPSTVMTMIVFGLTLLLMGRQTLQWREDASRRETRAARLVEDRYASLIANASDVIMIVDAQGTLEFASPAVERTLGFTPEAVVGRNLFDLWAGEDGERLRSFLASVAATTSGPVGPVELRIARGTQRFVVEIVGSNLTADPAVRGLALNFRDVSERKALEEQLRQLAFHDPLTLLANRNLFRDRVEHALMRTQRGREHVAVLFLDLDNFKVVNDSLGHDAGDRLLQGVAQRLVKATRSSDTVARLGGDEFAILLEEVGSREEACGVARALIEALGEPMPIGSSEARVAVSIGLVFSTPDEGAAALLSKADIAMYHAKAAGKNCYVAFEQQMLEQLQERVRLEADLAGAFANEEFFLEYQPVVDLGTRSLIGVEALVRWRHPRDGILMPGRFIQVAEECGRIVDLGRWVLKRACRDIRAWRTGVAGGHELRVSVNISGYHLQHGELVDDVAVALRESGFEPGNLVIELTESTIMYNTDANLQRLGRLKALGVRLAIDDFGTGYSSLSYLHRFPIDILKIDRSFVSLLTNVDNGPELARAVITLGETLGLDSVAEGIELEPQVTALLHLGCVAGQGYLFSKPTSLQHLSSSEFVARRNLLWSAQAHPQPEETSASGRYAALKLASRPMAGAA